MFTGKRLQKVCIFRVKAYFCTPKNIFLYIMEHQYETVVVLTPVMTEDQVKDTIAKYRGMLEKNGAKIVHQENWGLTKMAYQMQNKGTAYYTVIEYTAPTESIAKFELQLKRDESVLRFLTIALDKHAIAYNTRRRNGELKSQQKKSEKATA